MFERQIAAVALARVPRGIGAVTVSVRTVSVGERSSTRRMLQGDVVVTVVFEVTLTVLCSSEEACDAAEAALLQAAGDIASNIFMQVQNGSIIASILSEAPDELITVLDGLEITSIEVSDPVAIVTFRLSEPSSEPSLTPSESTQPSSEPSSEPSLTPSESAQPSSGPSSEPSSEPSSQPSSVPSSQPSSQPSSEPSSQPSSQPSSEPSSTPSCSPSSAPTESPSKVGGVNLFYPLWTSGSEGCR